MLKSAIETHLRLILVEDDPNIGRLLERFLAAEGFAVTWLKDGLSASRQIPTDQPDLVILDMGLPGMDGIEVAKSVRSGYDNSILMLTAHDGDLNEITALNVGIDDFLTKPVRPQVLLARLQALLRRQNKDAGSIIVVGDLHIDRAERRVFWRGDPLDISEAEFDVLSLLGSHVGVPISRDELFWRLRGKAYDGIDRAMDMRVNSLRKKLTAAGADNLIRAVRNKGYVLVQTAGSAGS